MVTQRWWPLPLFAASVGLLWLVEFFVVTSAGPQGGLIAAAVTLDLVGGIPLLGYLCLVRTRRAPSLILLPLFLLGLGLSYLTLPPGARALWHNIAALLPLGELVVAAAVVVTAVRVARAARRASQGPGTLYLSDALAEGAAAILGPSLGVRLLVLELSLLSLSLGGWFWRYRQRDPSHQVFSYHRRSPYAVVVGALAALSLVELSLLHLVLSQWSQVVAWAVTGLSAYSLWWVLGDFHALRLHPIVIDGQRLHLRTGLRWRLSVPLAQIAAVRTAGSWKPGPDGLNLALMGQPALLLECAEPVVAHDLFGRQRSVRVVGLSVDDPGAFLAALPVRLEAVRQR